MNITVLDGFTLNPGDNSWGGIAPLGKLTVFDRTPPELIVPRGADADIILTNKTPLSADTLAQFPRLRFVSVLATGFNVVDTGAAAARGIPVANVPEYGTDSVAQHALALLLELCNRVGLHDAAVKGGEWRESQDFSFWKAPLAELAGKTAGIVGMGRIGGRLARMLSALGMRIVAFNPRSRVAPEGVPVTWLGLEELFGEADVISLHCPLTPENGGFVNRGLLSLLRPGAFLVNTSRGGLVNEAELAEALNSGRLAGAAVDVVSVEPIRDDNPLLSARNCIVTPHIAWATLEARRRLMLTTAENIRAFLAGKPVNVVNGI